MGDWIRLREWYEKEDVDCRLTAREMGWPIEEWYRNLDRMKFWFPNMDFVWSEFGAYYVIQLTADYTARVSCCIRRSDWDKGMGPSCSLWLLDLERNGPDAFGGDTIDGISFLVDMENLSALRSWVPMMKNNYVHLWTEFDTLGVAMELLWSEVFEPRLRDDLNGQGLFVGAWCSGLSIDHDW